MIAVTCALGACGGTDDADIEEVIRGWANAANERDEKAFCNEFVTQEFAERVSGATGENAREQCEKLFKATRRGLSIEIIEVKDVEIDGDRASAVVNMRTTGAAAGDRAFELRKEDGDVKIASSGEE